MAATTVRARALRALQTVDMTPNMLLSQMTTHKIGVKESVVPKTVWTAYRDASFDTAAAFAQSLTDPQDCELLRAEIRPKLTAYTLATLTLPVVGVVSGIALTIILEEPFFPFLLGAIPGLGTYIYFAVLASQLQERDEFLANRLVQLQIEDTHSE